MNTRTESGQSPPTPPTSPDGETLRRAVAWAIDANIFAKWKPHGNTSWLPMDWILLAVVWVWSPHSTLTGAFVEAKAWSVSVLRRVAVGTYQGFLKSLVSSSAKFLPKIVEQLHRVMQEAGGTHWRIGRWVPIAVDGSRISTPRTDKNERAFCAPNYGNSASARHRRKKRAAKGIRRRLKKQQPVKPQIWLTLLWHMGLHMPWSWRSGPSYSSERDHFRTMLAEQTFPEQTLFCADAGFTGYDLWKAIVDGGHSFLIRVGGNVNLLRKYGSVRSGDGIVYFWPDAAARRGQPPLMLRLLHLQVGRRKMWLVTNVLDAKSLSETTAMELYRLRWGIELQFRMVKQTFGRNKLRSRTPDRALVELEWALLGLWLIQLFAIQEQIPLGKAPAGCSASLAIQVIRSMIANPKGCPEMSYAKRMGEARKDTYERKRPKRARYRPDSPDKPAAGKPKVKTIHRARMQRISEALNMAA
jgi:Transposase DDE domain